MGIFNLIRKRRRPKRRGGARGPKEPRQPVITSRRKAVIDGRPAELVQFDNGTLVIVEIEKS